MIESKHTPGDWLIVERELLEDGSVYPRHITGGARDLTICFLEVPSIAELAAKNPDSFYASDNMAESASDIRSAMANARLIAASPNLLKALELLVNRAFTQNLDVDEDWYADLVFAEDAIKEAKGE